MNKTNERQPLDDFFWRKLNDASVPPSADAWTHLQGRLSAKKSTVTDKPDRRIGATWYWAASMAAACLLVVYIGVNYSQSTLVIMTPDLATTIRPGKPITPRSNRSGESLAASETETSAPVIPLTNKSEQIVKSLKPSFEKQPEQGQKSVDRLVAEPKVEIEQPGLVTKNSEKQPEKIQVQPAPERTSVVAATNGEITAKASQISQERILIVSVVEATSNQELAETLTTKDDNLDVAQEAPTKNTRFAQVVRQIKRLKDGEALAKAEVSSSEDDDEIGLFNRLVRSARSKENQDKQQK